MNKILNELLTYYTYLEDGFNNSKTIKTQFEENYISFVIETKNKLQSFERYLINKEFSRAEAIISDLTLDSTILAKLNELIKTLKDTDTEYQNLETQKSKISTVNEKINNIEIILAELNTKFNQIENNIINPSKENSTSTISQDSINKINNYFSEIKNINISITNMENKIKELNPKIVDLDNKLQNHIQSVGNDFTQVMLSYRDQTISSVNDIKTSSINTSNMIMQDLPNQIKVITTEIPGKVETAISKSLWFNFLAFSGILTIVMIALMWMMGTTMGDRTRKNIVHDILINYNNSFHTATTKQENQKKH